MLPIEEYYKKLDEQIADQQKFHKISRDKTTEFKTHINKNIGNPKIH